MKTHGCRCSYTCSDGSTATKKARPPFDERAFSGISIQGLKITLRGRESIRHFGGLIFGLRLVRAGCWNQVTSCYLIFLSLTSRAGNR